MSTINVEVVALGSIHPHPNADRLEIAEVLGAECCVPKGRFTTGDIVLWFPPNLLIPEAVSEKLGVTQYLKTSVYPGHNVSTRCRVAATRLRGASSFGFVASLEDAVKAAIELDLPFSEAISAGKVVPGNFGVDTETLGVIHDLFDVDSYFGAVKYEPPAAGLSCGPRPKGFNADAAPPCDAFHKYTDIENFYKYKNAIPEGTQVRITEKLHGMNVRLGLIRMDDGEFEFMAGSHKVNWKPQDSCGNTPIWWQLMTEPVMNLLSMLCNEENSVIVFGEIYGPGIQDMDYGAEEFGLRVFDISVNGVYLDYQDLLMICDRWDIERVPTLYIGPFTREVLREHTDGPTTVADASKIKAKFKGREGIVVTPLVEQRRPGLGRVIVKSISADYLDRKNAQDN